MPEEKKILTNHDVLLSQGLVEFEDTMDGKKKQVTVEVAKRIAKGNTVMRDHLVELGILTKEEKPNE